MAVGRWQKLERARVYFVTDAFDGVAAALAGGVDVVQLRDKAASDDAILRRAAGFRRVCDEHGALFVLNDRPDLAAECGADGVHVGQDEESVEAVRKAVGDDLLIGLSTHSAAQFDAGLESAADYLCAGPVWETPTKPGRAATGLSLVRHAAERASKPWFAIGGIDPTNVGEVAAAGAERVVVVRAIRDADDPRAAAAVLREVLERGAVGAV